MKPSIFILIVVTIIAASCTPQKRLNRLLKKHPELMITTVDTVVIDTFLTIPGKSASVTFKSLPEDTLTFVKNGIRFTVIPIFNSNKTIIDSVKVNADVEPDTVVFKKEIPITRDAIIVKDKPKDTRFSLFLIVIISFEAFVIVLLLLLLIKNRN